MPFHFPLEAMLRLRTTLTRQEELKLETISKQLSAARQRREAVREQLREFDRATADELRRGIDGGELQLRATGRRGLLRIDQELGETIAKLEADWEQQRQKFVEARQREEVLQKVRERQWDAFQEEQRRRDQQVLDDLFLAGHNRQS